MAWFLVEFDNYDCFVQADNADLAKQIAMDRFINATKEIDESILKTARNAAAFEVRRNEKWGGFLFEGRGDSQTVIIDKHSVFI